MTESAISQAIDKINHQLSSVGELMDNVQGKLTALKKALQGASED